MGEQVFEKYDTPIEAGNESGEFRSELSSQIITMAIFGMINWIYRWYQPNGNRSLNKIAQIYTDFVLYSLLTEENKQREEFHHVFLRS
jgi:hypothetical protein